MGIALVSPVGSNGRRRSALGRVMLLSATTVVAIAAPILVSLRHHGPTTTTVITGDPSDMAQEVGLGPLLDRRWVEVARQDPMADLLSGAVELNGGPQGSGAPGEAASKPPDGAPVDDAAPSTSGTCASCETDAEDIGDASGTGGGGEAAPAPITIVHPTTTRPPKVTTPTTSAANSGSSSIPSGGTTPLDTVPGGSTGSTSTTVVSSTVPTTTTTVPGGSEPQIMMLPAVAAGGEVVEHRLEFNGGILWLRISSSGLTLLDVVAKQPFGVDNVNSEQDRVRVRFRSDQAREEILAEFLVDGRTRVTSTTEPG